MNGSNLNIQHRVSNAARAGCSTSPLAVARTRDLQQPAHSCNRKLAAVCIHPGVPHRTKILMYVKPGQGQRRSGLLSVLYVHAGRFVPSKSRCAQSYLTSQRDIAAHL